MANKPTSVNAYLEQLPPDRRETIEAVRAVILKNLDKGYEEGIQYGMIGYYVPHRVFPDGYHCDPKQPLPFMSLASTKGHIGLHMFCIYGDQSMQAWFRDAWAKAGKKLDMGAACVRVKKLEDIALDVVAEAVRRLPTAKFVESYVRMRDGLGLAKAGKAAKAARATTDAKATSPAKTAKKSAKKSAKKATKKATSAKKATTARPAAKPAPSKGPAEKPTQKPTKKPAKKAAKKSTRRLAKGSR